MSAATAEQFQAQLLRTSLVDRLARLKSVAVAFSGGVDSAVVAKAAQVALGSDAIAVTAVSPSLPRGESEHAIACAAQIGISHRLIETDELTDQRYVRNQGDRCYWCKTELYRQLTSMLDELGAKHIVNGTNLDDLADYRPGLQSAEEHGVISPLAECAINKIAVRAIARSWNLNVWDKPAGPCLASRLAPGVCVTDSRLRMIDCAESFIRDLGFTSVRVRLHQDELARIEVDPGQLDKLSNRVVRKQIDEHLRQLGFKFVTVDLSGFRSGSMNGLVRLKRLEC